MKQNKPTSKPKNFLGGDPGLVEPQTPGGQAIVEPPKELARTDFDVTQSEGLDIQEVETIGEVTPGAKFDVDETQQFDFKQPVKNL